jgi:hypothetical protein
MLTIVLCLALGVALTYVVPTGVEPGTKYRAPTESDFQELLRRRGLSE